MAELVACIFWGMGARTFGGAMLEVIKRSRLRESSSKRGSHIGRRTSKVCVHAPANGGVLPVGQVDRTDTEPRTRACSSSKRCWKYLASYIQVTRRCENRRRRNNASMTMDDEL